MDILIRLRDLYINFVYALPDGFTSFILRMSILLALTIGLLMLTWHKLPWCSVFSQACVAFIAVVASLYIPVNVFREIGKEVFAFSVGVGLLCMIFLPGWLPFYLTPRFGNQLRLKKIIQYLIWSLFILQLISEVITHG